MEKHSPNIVRAIKSGKLRWKGHVATIEENRRSLKKTPQIEFEPSVIFYCFSTSSTTVHWLVSPYGGYTSKELSQIELHHVFPLL